MIVWRGRGELAIVALIPAFGSCIGLFNVEPRALCGTVGGLAVVLGGWFCAYYGQRWNRHGARHSLYFVRLQVWGWIYLALAAAPAALVFALGSMALVAGARGRDDPNELPYAIAGGGVVLCAAAVALYSALRQMRDRRENEDDEDGNDRDDDDFPRRRDRRGRYFDRDGY